MTYEEIWQYFSNFFWKKQRLCSFTLKRSSTPRIGISVGRTPLRIISFSLLETCSMRKGIGSHCSTLSILLLAHPFSSKGSCRYSGLFFEIYMYICIRTHTYMYEYPFLCLNIFSLETDVYIYIYIEIYVLTLM